MSHVITRDKHPLTHVMIASMSLCCFNDKAFRWQVLGYLLYLVSAFSYHSFSIENRLQDKCDEVRKESVKQYSTWYTQVTTIILCRWGKIDVKFWPLISYLLRVNGIMSVHKISSHVKNIHRNDVQTTKLRKRTL